MKSFVDAARLPAARHPLVAARPAPQPGFVRSIRIFLAWTLGGTIFGWALIAFVWALVS